MSGKHARTLLGVAIFLFCFLSTAYYYHGASWNQNSRLDPVFSFVEPGSADFRSFRINRFIVFDGKTAPTENTGDWAWFDGNFYSNKAPGTVLLGVIAYLAVYETERLLGVEASNPKLEILNAYMINLFVSAVPVALCISLFFLLLVNNRLSPPNSVAIALCLFLGTALFPYSTQLWGHTTTAALMFFSLYSYQGNSRNRIFWTGLLAGFAVCVDYHAFIFVVVLGASLAIRHKENILQFVAGGGIPLALFMFYHAICFGSPIAFASSFSNAAFLDQARLFGLIDTPSIAIVWKLSFSQGKGIFFHMPVLLMGIAGYFYWMKSNPRDEVLWVTLATTLIYVLFISGFNGWHGGATVTARYLIPVIPFLFWALKAIPWSRQYSAIFSSLAIISVVNMSAVAAVSPLIEDGTSNPLMVTYTRLLNGELHPFDLYIRLHKYHPDLAEFSQFTAWNVGELLGMEGLSSVAPLILFQIVCVSGLFIMAKRLGGVAG